MPTSTKVQHGTTEVKPTSVQRDHIGPHDAGYRLALRMADLVNLTGLSRRLIERERSAGRFPAPDKMVGRCPLWKCSTIDTWLSSGIEG